MMAVRKKTVRKVTKKRGPVQCVVKHGSGKCESYDERKVYGSVYAACWVAHMSHPKCHKFAVKVAAEVTKTIKKKKEMHATHIHAHVIKHLKKHSKEAAYMYEHHKDVS